MLLLDKRSTERNQTEDIERKKKRLLRVCPPVWWLHRQHKEERQCRCFHERLAAGCWQIECRASVARRKCTLHVGLPDVLPPASLYLPVSCLAILRSGCCLGATLLFFGRSLEIKLIKLAHECPKGGKRLINTVTVFEEDFIALLFSCLVISVYLLLDCFAFILFLFSFFFPLSFLKSANIIWGQKGGCDGQLLKTEKPRKDKMADDYKWKESETQSREWVGGERAKENPRDSPTLVPCQEANVTPEPDLRSAVLECCSRSVSISLPLTMARDQLINCRKHKQFCLCLEIRGLQKL